MLKHERKGEKQRQPWPASKKPMLDGQEARKLDLMLINGVSAATSYCTMTRDRYYVSLRGGVTKEQLLQFCLKELGGNPIPDRAMDGHIMVSIFKNAEGAGLVTVEFVKAGQFMPELKEMP